MSAGEWIAHNGKGMPVAGDVMVLCRFSDGHDEYVSGKPPLTASFWDGCGPEVTSNWIAIEVGEGDAITEYKVIQND